MGSIRYSSTGGSGNNGPYLHFDRSGGASGVNCWTSDERIKDNLLELPSPNSKGMKMLSPNSEIRGLELVKNIRHYSFDYKDTGAKISVGYSANQLKEVSDSLVFAVPQPVDSEYYEEGDAGLLHPDHTTLIPNLTLAIQEQQVQIETVTRENALLREMLSEMEARLTAIERG